MGCCCSYCGDLLLENLMGIMESRALMMGLDQAGKTSLLYRWKLGEYVVTIPTTGFNVETIETDGQSLTVWDVGGGAEIRPLWRHYYQNTEAVIFVIDSTDTMRLGHYDRIKDNIYDEYWLHDLKLLVDGYIRLIDFGDTNTNTIIPIDIISLCFDFCNDEDTLGAEPAVVALHKTMREDELRDAFLLVLANKQDEKEIMSIDEISDRLGLQVLKEKRPTIIMGCSAKNNKGLQQPLKWLTEQKRIRRGR